LEQYIFKQLNDKLDIIDLLLYDNWSIGRFYACPKCGARGRLGMGKTPRYGVYCVYMLHHNSEECHLGRFDLRALGPEKLRDNARKITTIIKTRRAERLNKKNNIERLINGNKDET
jgi:hypothetical protein